MAILNVLSDILLAIDAGDLSALVLLDLSAAFDTVDHNILLRWLEHTYQLGGVALEWFRSHLVGRRQREDQLFILGSSFYHVRCAAGVSTPLILFLQYTANLLSLIERHGFIPHLNADDTQILGSCRPSASQDLLMRLSACIDEVAAWMRSNWIQLNTAKTEFLWSTTSCRCPQSAATVTAPSRLEPYFTSFCHSRPWNIH